jgi:VIT1/CCC1 family predicted Fe2+/Mn2+ transporter
VFGVNDGLVSNLALIMGVAAGAADANFVVLAGIAGLVAGAGSMAAGEWISVQSQSELLQREIDVERAELEAFPDEEQAELEWIYRSKGLSAEDAAAVARQIMSNTDMALDTLVREELGLDPSDLGSPWTAAVSSFFAFAVGAVLPLLPFLLATGAAALVVSMALSVTALAAVGAVLSVFTGRSAWWSALRMTLIGGSAAAATYGIGAAVGMGVG